MKTFATLVVVLALTLTASAQTIKPRGFTPSATTTTTTTADNTPTTETPAAAETQEPAMTSDQKLDAIIGQTEGFARRIDVRDLSSDISKLNEVNQKWMDRLEDAQLQMNKKLGWIFWLTILVAFMVALFLAGMVVTIIQNRRADRDNPTPTGTSVVPALIFLSLLSMGLASHAQATTPSECTIRSISSGSVIVKEQEPAEIKISVRNCTDVKSVTAATSGMTFTDVTQKGNIVIAKVTADATTLTGPTSFKLALADGNEAMSPDTIYLLVLDPATAVVRKDATVAIGKVAKTVKALESKVETVSVTRPTKDEVAMAIAPLQRKIADLEKFVIVMKEEVTTANNRIAALGVATATLADGQVALGNTQVKKGFWGKKSLNPEVAEAAKQIRDAFLSAPTPVVAANN